MTQMVMWAVNENYDIYTIHSDTQWLPTDKNQRCVATSFRDTK